MVRLTDCLDMNIVDYRGRKATTQQQQHPSLNPNISNNRQDSDKCFNFLSSDMRLAMRTKQNSFSIQSDASAFGEKKPVP